MTSSSTAVRVTIDCEHQFNSFQVLNGGVVRHSAEQTDGLNLDVTFDVYVDGTSSINLNTRGYGPDAGPGKGAGHSGAGGGGGYGGSGGRGGSSSTPYGAGGSEYGSITAPVDLGSGGGSDTHAPGTAGRGGGALQLAVSGQLQLDGAITANGGAGTGSAGVSGGGSGGSIYISADTFTGSGTITANGGAGYDAGGTDGGGGGGGRVAIYYGTDSYTGSIQARGASGWEYGGAGTIFKKADSQAYGDLLVENGGQNGKSTWVSGDYDFDEVRAQSKGKMTLDGQGMTIGGVTVGNAGELYLYSPTEAAWGQVDAGGTLSASSGTVFDLTVLGDVTVAGTVMPTTAQRLMMAVGGDLTVITGGKFTGNTRGYGPDAGPGKGSGHASAGGGGGYGGSGGRGGSSSTPYGAGGSEYGSITAPVDLGSGGGSDTHAPGTAGRGGGALQLAVSGQLQLDGAITANGGAGTGPGGVSGGGSGGSIYISADTFTGSGTITANGGAGYDAGGTDGGGGGGGRVAIYYGTDSYTGSIQARGASGWEYGGAGTIFKKADSQAYGDLLVENGGQNGKSTWVSGDYDFDEVRAQSKGKMTLDGQGMTIGGVTVGNAGELYLYSPTEAAWGQVDAGGTLSAGAGLVFDLTVLGDADVTVAGTVMPTTAQRLMMAVGGDLTVITGGKFTGNTRGYGPDAGPGKGSGHASAGGGGGYGGSGGRGGSSSTPYGAGGSEYGSITAPVGLGSGGGSDTHAPGTAGRGGGALQLAVSGQLQLDGAITANGGAGTGPGGVSGGGSGGSIYISADTFTGSGTITANGGAGYDAGGTDGGGGGGGRVAIYYGTDSYTGSIQARGASGWEYGGAGTIFKKADSQAYGDLLVENGGQNGKSTWVSGDYDFDEVRAQSKGKMTLDGQGMTIGGVTVGNAGELYLYSPTEAAWGQVDAGGTLSAGAGLVFDLTVLGDVTVAGTVMPTTAQRLMMAVGGDLTVITGGKFTGNTRGYGPDAGPGKGSGHASAGGGGGYGGSGGRGGSSSTPYGAGGSEYGSITAPVGLGSGGGSDTHAPGTAGRGGGALQLAVSGQLQLDGAITANGGAGTGPGGVSGGGSGGSIYISADTFTGSGTITANGGAGYDAGGTDGGGGGGGRVAIYYESAFNFPSSNVSVVGGSGWESGEPGTFYLAIGVVRLSDTIWPAASYNSNTDVLTITALVYDRTSGGFLTIGDVAYDLLGEPQAGAMTYDGTRWITQLDFSSAPLPAGQYTVQVSSDDGNATASFQVGETTGDLGGFVLDTASTAIPSAAIDVFESTAYYSGGATPVANTTTGPDGGYLLPDLPVGYYVVTASAAGYADQHTNVHVLAETTTQADLTLSSGQTLATLQGPMQVLYEHAAATIQLQTERLSTITSQAAEHFNGDQPAWDWISGISGVVGGYASMGHGALQWITNHASRETFDDILHHIIGVELFQSYYPKILAEAYVTEAVEELAPAHLTDWHHIATHELQSLTPYVQATSDLAAASELFQLDADTIPVHPQFDFAMAQEVIDLQCEYFTEVIEDKIVNWVVLPDPQQGVYGLSFPGTRQMWLRDHASLTFLDRGRKSLTVLKTGAAGTAAYAVCTGIGAPVAAVAGTICSAAGWGEFTFAMAEIPYTCRATKLYGMSGITWAQDTSAIPLSYADTREFLEAEAADPTWLREGNRYGVSAGVVLNADVGNWVFVLPLIHMAEKTATVAITNSGNVASDYRVVATGWWDYRLPGDWPIIGGLFGGVSLIKVPASRSIVAGDDMLHLEPDTYGVVELDYSGFYADPQNMFSPHWLQVDIYSGPFREARITKPYFVVAPLGKSDGRKRRSVRRVVP